MSATAPCHFCGTVVDRTTGYCAGCETVICGACDHSPDPPGPHHRAVHRVADED